MNFLFLQGKICVSARVASRLRNIFLSEFSVLKINPRRKNYISGYIWHRSFIQTVKCSFLDEKFVCQSFYDAPFTFSYFLLQGKVLFHTRQQVACEMFIVESVPKTLSKKLYLWLYLTQIVHSNSKMHFL